MTDEEVLSHLCGNCGWGEEDALTAIEEIKAGETDYLQCEDSEGFLYRVGLTEDGKLLVTDEKFF